MILPTLHYQNNMVNACGYAMVSQLVPTVPLDRVSWLLPAIQKLNDLQQTGRQIPGVGDLRISEQTSSLVRRLLSNITNAELPIPVLSPISGGGIAVRWNITDKEVSFVVFPDDEDVVYVVSDERDEITQEGTVKIGEPISIENIAGHLAPA